jgi:hypothetical protein
MNFKVTEAGIREAIRNATVFGNTTFSPVFVGILHSTKRGFPLVGSEEIYIVHTELANELRRIYLRSSKEFDAGKITAEQFRNNVQPLLDKLTDRGLKGLTEQN